MQAPQDVVDLQQRRAALYAELQEVETELRRRVAYGNDFEVEEARIPPIPVLQLTYDTVGWAVGQDLRLVPTVSLACNGADEENSMISWAQPSDGQSTRVETFPSMTTPGSCNAANDEGSSLMPSHWRCSDGVANFHVEPELPQGLRLDTRTGLISGSLEAAFDAGCDFRVTCEVRASTVLRVQRQEEEILDEDQQVSMTIDQDFATRLEAINDLANMLPEPSRNLAFGDWMIWMVHRAYLNDPSLVELDFSGLHMPPAHIEARIAPKLMAAISWNTHIEVLNLSSANMQNAQGPELAQALQSNTTLRVVNIESNSLDSISVRKIANAIQDNKEGRIEQLHVAHQKLAGKYFGRPTEEALGLMMQNTESIVKLGLECDDAHWRNVIDRALLRNNDIMRRRQRYNTDEDLRPVEERPLGQVALRSAPPSSTGSERCPTSRAGGLRGSNSVASTSAGASSAGASAGGSEDEDNVSEDRQRGGGAPMPPRNLLLDYVLRNLKVPNTTQLQNYARNSGGPNSGRCAPLSYTVAAPLIKEFITGMLDAAVGSEVVATDVFGTDVVGTLNAWTEDHGNWHFDITGEEDRRFAFRSKKEPTFAVSSDWVAFLLRQD